MEETLSTGTGHPELPFLRRNFIGGLWHGAFLALGMALTQPTTVISAFVADLTGSTIWVGGLATVLTVAGALPQLFVARWMEPIVFKKPYLLAAIYLRVLSWGTLAWLIHAIGGQQPITLAWILVGILTVFYAGGGMANIPFTDIVGTKSFQRENAAHFLAAGARWRRRCPSARHLRRGKFWRE